MAKSGGKGGSLDTRGDPLKNDVNVNGINALVSIGLLSADLKFICSQHLLICAFGLKTSEIVTIYSPDRGDGGHVLGAQELRGVGK